eukprot:7883709-Ditylum_brightwellii.AAC.1
MKLVKKFSNNIGVPFSFDMCTVLTIHDGKAVVTDILNKMPILDSDEGYKFLGVLENLDFVTKEVKDATIKEYFSVVHEILTVKTPGK